MSAAELLRIRKRLGLTQQAFAERVGVTRNTIARQERGELGIGEPLARLIRLLANSPSPTRRRRGAR